MLIDFISDGIVFRVSRITPRHHLHKARQVWGGIKGGLIYCLSSLRCYLGGFAFIVPWRTRVEPALASSPTPSPSSSSWTGRAGEQREVCGWGGGKHKRAHWWVSPLSERINIDGQSVSGSSRSCTLPLRKNSIFSPAPAGPLVSEAPFSFPGPGGVCPGSLHGSKRGRAFFAPRAGSMGFINVILMAPKTFQHND